MVAETQSEREARLKQALRSNLRKRKQQDAERSQPPAQDGEGADLRSA